MTEEGEFKVTPEWEERTKAIVRVDSSQERHRLLGESYDAGEIRKMTYYMTLEELQDMTEWSEFEIHPEGADPPYYFRRIYIPILCKKYFRGGIPVPILAAFTGIAFIIAMFAGASIGKILLLGTATTLLIFSTGATLAQYAFRKAGQCHKCGKTIDTEKKIMVMKRTRDKKEGEERHHSHAGLCDDCEAKYTRWDAWYSSLHGRIDLIFSKAHKCGVDKWKDPITGVSYSSKEKIIPKNRNLNYWLEKLERHNIEQAKILKEVMKQKRRFRLG